MRSGKALKVLLSGFFSQQHFPHSNPPLNNTFSVVEWGVAKRPIVLNKSQDDVHRISVPRPVISY